MNIFLLKSNVFIDKQGYEYENNEHKSIGIIYKVYSLDFNTAPMGFSQEKYNQTLLSKKKLKFAYYTNNGLTGNG